MSEQGVVALSNYMKDMKSPAIQAIEAYWHGLREGRDVPLRSDIDPRGIERALEYTFILERIAPGLARFRLAGMHLTDLMGMEVRGMPFTSFFAPQSRKPMQQILESVFGGPEIAELSLKAERGMGKPPMDAQVVLLPLRSDLGDVSRAVGCLVAMGPIGRAPRRFELSQTRLRKVVDGINTAPAPRAPRLHTGFAEVPVTFSTPSGVATASPEEAPARPKRPHLRLIKNEQ